MYANQMVSCETYNEYEEAKKVLGLGKIQVSRYEM